MMDNTGDRPVKQVRWSNRTVVVDLHGDIDLAHKDELLDFAAGLVDQQPSRIILNLTEVPFMDSSGAASFIKILAIAREAAVDLRLFGFNDQVTQIFKITHLDSVFSIFDTEADALA